MIDGALMASPGFAVSRSNDLSNASSANVDRIEITKTPTPDMPANAVGGSINMVTKSGFSRTKPLFSYNVFIAYNDSGGFDDPSWNFDRMKGADPKGGFRRIQPAVNLSYIFPVNKSLALTFTANYAPRYGSFEYHNTTWDQVANIQTGNVTNIILSGTETKMASVSADWRATKDNIFRFSYQRSDVYKMIRQNQFQRTLGTGTTGNATASQGASTGVGSIGRVYDSNSQYLDMDMATMSYRHEGAGWKLAANFSFSKGNYVTKNTEDGFFTAVATTGVTNLVLRMDGLDGVYDRKVPVLTATDRTGAVVDPYRLVGTQPINSVSATKPIRRQEILAGAVHVTREVPWSVPVTFKTGVATDRQERKVSADGSSWTFTPPGAATAREIRNFDVIATEFNSSWYSTDGAGNKVHPEFLSTAKVYDLYKQNPSWFVLNEAAAHQTAVTNRRELEETITAGYIRADARFLQNKLWLVGGVRFERTEDKGRGPLNDIAATFVKNPDGTFARNAAGAKIPVTTDALERTKLQFKMLGATSEKSYDGYYPSFNASYSVSDGIVFRAAYARTIGRPDLGSIIPGVTITDPDSTSALRTITVVNSGLKPWTANNYDLTAESYHIKGATASVSLFEKDLSGFFTGSTTTATQELLESFDVPWEDFYSGYDVVTTRNGGRATLRGIELSYRQSLYFLPSWARGFQVFGNITSMSLHGPDQASLRSYAPRNINWGVNYSRAKFSVNVNVALQKWVRLAEIAASATVPAGTYQFTRNSPRVDLSCEYNFTRSFGIYGGVRNALAVPNARIRTNGEVPFYAQPNQYQYNFALFTLGLKGTF